MFEIIKSMSNLSKVLAGTTVALAAATTMSVIKDKKAAKDAECPCDGCTEAEADEAEEE